MTLNITKPVFMMLVPLLMLHRNWDTSFKFPKFSGPYTNSLITFQGDAVASSSGAIELTKADQNGRFMKNSAGRATYALPVRLWDSKTGKMARFTSNFTLDITIGPNDGDGISFFLAPFKSDMPQDSHGGYLGLFSPDTAFRNINHNQIVAVEFDTHPNEWDPAGAHIGIDVNSISSVATEDWVIYGFPTVFATVTYDPVAKSLSVVVVIGDTTMIRLSHVIDLRTVLPEWVSVGFSGATGFLTGIHKIDSWSFSSSFD